MHDQFGVPSVRGARPGDIERLREIFRAAAWSNTGDRPLLTEHPEFLEWNGLPAREGRTHVAVLGEDLVGFISTIARPDAWEIEDLFVDPAWMRRGVATALVEHVVALAHAARCGSLVVDANSHALAFYRSVGFDGATEVPTEGGVAALRMCRVVDLSD